MELTVEFLIMSALALFPAPPPKLKLATHSGGHPGEARKRLSDTRVSPNATFSMQSAAFNIQHAVSRTTQKSKMISQIVSQVSFCRWLSCTLCDGCLGAAPVNYFVGSFELGSHWGAKLEPNGAKWEPKWSLNWPPKHYKSLQQHPCRKMLNVRKVHDLDG